MRHAVRVIQPIMARTKPKTELGLRFGFDLRGLLAVDLRLTVGFLAGFFLLNSQPNFNNPNTDRLFPVRALRGLLAFLATARFLTAFLFFGIFAVL